MSGAQDTMSGVGVAWLRPEYQGREAELVTLSEGAELVGVCRSTVSMWAARHQDSPALTLVTGSPKQAHQVRHAELDQALGRPAVREFGEALQVS
ncbi:hypothetical protein GCM10009716_49280 [Streptomyces sodiiphilus]|uniref:Helix-turn-helix domain-containing protein n=1 Tax=Streptomyces sodiiphilus TaxID=226217 RepID=A0ABN2PXH1_9ACTN